MIDYGGSAWKPTNEACKRNFESGYEACETGAMKKDAEKALATFAAVRRSFMFEENDAEFGHEWEEKLMEKIMDAGGLRAVEETDGNEDEGEGKPSANLDAAWKRSLKYYPRGVSALSMPSKRTMPKLSA